MMNKRLYFSRLLQGVFCTLGVLLLGSCKNDDYLNALPADATALLVLETPKSIVDFHGVDMGNEVYCFADAAGNLGACVPVSDADAVEAYINGMAQKGQAEPVEQKRGFRFSLLGNGFLAGFSDNTLLLIGPMVSSDKAAYVNELARLLKQSDEESGKNSRLFAAVDTLHSTMRIVARVDALPQQMITPFMIGAPKGAKASDVYLLAEMKNEHGLLDLQGHTYSYNKEVEVALRAAESLYHPISGKYVQSMPDSAMLGMFLHVSGKDFIKVVRGNEGLQALLSGINRAIDMDKIIESTEGDLALVVPVQNEERMELQMAADLGDTHWLSDVPYWKQSTPPGSRITDWMPNAYCYTDGKLSYCFGVNDKKQYFSGASKEAALQSIGRATHPLPEAVRRKIQDEKLVLLLNLNWLNAKQGAIGSLLTPLLGKTERVIYRLK